jgi:hypothetical protein
MSCNSHLELFRQRQLLFPIPCTYLMAASFSVGDIASIVVYFVIILSIALYHMRKSRGHQQAQRYFLADRSAPWWAVGCSLFASNIGSEHFVGLAGSGAKVKPSFTLAICTIIETNFVRTGWSWPGASGEALWPCCCLRGSSCLFTYPAPCLPCLSTRPPCRPLIYPKRVSARP